MRILYNANIHTLDPKQPVATAMAIDKGRVLAVGDSETILSAFSGGVEKIDASHATVIPGISDAHIHLQQYALVLSMMDCETSTRAECLARVAECALKTPPGEWIIGHGWNDNNWPDGMGSCYDLDRVVQNQPVYLTAKSLHAAWVNSAALVAAGIDASTPDPPKGRIGRDEHGQPNGLLFESAIQLVAAKIPEPRSDQLIEAIRNAQFRLAQMGLTSLHDFDRWSCLVALQKLYEHGELRLRVTKSIPMEDLSLAIEMGIRTGTGDDFLRMGGVKMFADGALGPRTAAMIDPYTGEPANTGLLALDSQELFDRSQIAVNNRISLCIHAIGDLANREVLNAMDKLRQDEDELFKREGPSPLRHRIEHVQLIHPVDAQRLAKMRVIASMQPIHASSDMQMAEKYWGNRTAYAYAWRTLLINGAILAFGSDAPVETPNPFRGIYAAITRRRPDGYPGPDGWHPEQKLSVSEALNAYSTGPAYATGLENRLGKLSAGYLADLLLLEIDPFNCQAEQLLETCPLATMVAGEWIFQR
jgi:predicted amidohydrolase YtcJ